MNQWQMFSGQSNTSLLQRARFLTTPTGWTQNNTWQTGAYNNSVNHLHIESSRGDVVFDAAGSLDGEDGQPNRADERMRISAHSFVDSAYNSEPKQYARVSISGIPNFPVTEPLSLLHLGGPWNYEQAGHRNWMHWGMGIYRGDDNVWLGLKQREDVATIDNSDAVLTWGDNGPDTPGWTPDNFRIVYCSPYNTTADSGTAGHLHGLEVFRITPDATTGVGDYSLLGPNPPGSANYIDAKLDIDGDLRIRSVLENDTLTHVLLIDSTDLNRVYYKEVEPGGLECDWNVVNAGEDVAMGYAPNPNEDDACVPGNVGIGLLPAANNRLDLFKAAPASTSMENGINTLTIGGSVSSNSINVRHSGSGGFVIGVNSISAAVTNCLPITTMGMRGEASGSSLLNFGMYGAASTNCETCGSVAYGLYGTASAMVPGCQQAWGGWFQGNVNIQGGNLFINQAFAISDESLKNTIEPLEGALDKLMNLQPKTYYFNETGYDGNALPTGQQLGFIAQETEEVIPEVVQYVEFPEQVDSAGIVTADAMNVKAINYDGIIPVIVGGIQEQQTQIESLQSQLNDANDNIATLSAVLSECCAIDIQLKSMHGNDIQIVPAKQKLNELYQNTPNPFEQFTTIAYNLEEASQAKVVIYNQFGEVVVMLVDGFGEAGVHQVQWQSGNHASGVYYYALIVDGIEHVKKAVKL